MQGVLVAQMEQKYPESGSPPPNSFQEQVEPGTFNPTVSLTVYLDEDVPAENPHFTVSFNAFYHRHVEMLSVRGLEIVVACGAEAMSRDSLSLSLSLNHSMPLLIYHPKKAQTATLNSSRKSI